MNVNVNVLERRGGEILGAKRLSLKPGTGNATLDELSGEFHGAAFAPAGRCYM